MRNCNEVYVKLVYVFVCLMPVISQIVISSRVTGLLIDAVVNKSEQISLTTDISFTDFPGNTSLTMLSRGGESRYPRLVFSLKGKALFLSIKYVSHGFL